MHLLTIEQIADEQLDQIVELANLQWQAVPGKLTTDPKRLTHLMACHLIRAYLAVIQDDVEEMKQKVGALENLNKRRFSSGL